MKLLIKKGKKKVLGMILVFDTSILIEIERKNLEMIEEIKKLAKSNPGSPEITFVTYYEFIKGIKLNKKDNKQALYKFLNNFKVLKINLKTADILSDLKIKYDKIGISLSITDLLIAAQVIENNNILVTKDKDFSYIEELTKIIL